MQLSDGQTFASLADDAINFQVSEGGTVTVSGDGNEEPASIVIGDITAGKVRVALIVEGCTCQHKCLCFQDKHLCTCTHSMANLPPHFCAFQSHLDPAQGLASNPPAPALRRTEASY